MPTYKIRLEGAANLWYGKAKTALAHGRVKEATRRRRHHDPTTKHARPLVLLHAAPLPFGAAASGFTGPNRRGCRSRGPRAEC